MEEKSDAEIWELLKRCLQDIVDTPDNLQSFQENYHYAHTLIHGHEKCLRNGKMMYEYVDQLFQTQIRKVSQKFFNCRSII